MFVFKNYDNLSISYQESKKYILSTYDGKIFLKDCLNIWFCSTSSKEAIHSVASINKFVGLKFYDNIGFGILNLIIILIS